MAPSRKPTKEISLREETSVPSAEMPDTHRIWLSALCELAVAKRTPHYIGVWKSTGRIDFRFYGDEAQYPGYLLEADDPAKICTAIAIKLFTERDAESMARLATRRLATAAQERAK